MGRRCFHCNRISESYETFRSSAAKGEVFALCKPRGRHAVLASPPTADDEDRDCVTAYAESEANSLRLLECNLAFRRHMGIAEQTANVEGLVVATTLAAPSTAVSGPTPPLMSVDNRTVTEVDASYWIDGRGSRDGALDGTLADPATFSGDDLNMFHRKISEHIRTLDVLPFSGRCIEDEPQWTCGGGGGGEVAKGPRLFLKQSTAENCSPASEREEMEKCVPLTTISSFVAAADWAQCGKGFRTVRDLSARRTLRIPSSNVEARWPSSASCMTTGGGERSTGGQDGLTSILRTVSARLCPYWRLRAELHDVLLYRCGDMFRTHRDSRKGDRHVMTLVVGVGGISDDVGDGEATSNPAPTTVAAPSVGGSAISGGVVRFTPCTFFSDVHGNGTECSGNSSTSDEEEGAAALEHNQWECKGEGSWCAWFIETEHEVTPVTSGFRCVAAYNVFIDTESEEEGEEVAAEKTSSSTEDHKDPSPCPSSLVPSSSSFCALPVDVLRLVVDYLTMPTVKALRMTCRWVDRDVVGGIVGVAAGNLCHFKVLPIEERRGRRKQNASQQQSSSAPLHDGHSDDEDERCTYMNIPKEWLLKACAWGNHQSIGFVAGYNYSLDGREKIVGTEEALLLLRGKDRLRALALCEALRRVTFTSSSSFPSAAAAPANCDGEERTIRVRPSLVVMPTLGYVEKSTRHRRGGSVHFAHGGSFSWTEDYDKSYIYSALGDRTTLRDGRVVGFSNTDTDDGGGGTTVAANEEHSAAAAAEADNTITVAYGNGFRRVPHMDGWPSLEFDMECDEGCTRYTSIDELRHCFMMSGAGTNWYYSPALVGPVARQRCAREATRVFKGDPTDISSDDSDSDHSEVALEPMDGDGATNDGGSGNAPVVEKKRKCPSSLLVAKTDELWGNQAVFRAYVYRKVAVIVTFELYCE